MNFLEHALIVAFLILKGALNLTNSMPLRTTAIHFCCPPMPLSNVYKAICMLIMKGTGNKMRFIYHEGQESEVKYKMMSYGIPVDCEFQGWIQQAINI